MITVVGGTYQEICKEPHWNELYGSGLRATIALLHSTRQVSFTTCIGLDKRDDLHALCNAYNIPLTTTDIEQTVTFEYHSPLSLLRYYSSQLAQAKKQLPPVAADSILFYALIEADVAVHGKRVVYDPQSGVPVPFRSTGSTADHLAVVLNSREARFLYGQPDADTQDLEHIGRYLLASEDAEVVVIKNGALGALVIELSGTQTIPVFETATVFSIGSGDIFSAVFAWQWLHEQRPAAEAALLASRLTAQYCRFKYLPLPPTPDENFPAVPPRTAPRKIYLAGPFFTLQERWMITECRDKLEEFGNQVFSPYHHIGIGAAKDVVPKDIEAIQWCDTVFAVLDGFDPGTVFEIGYAKALGKKVVALVANSRPQDLTMLIGTDCDITHDLTTAVYKASW